MNNHGKSLKRLLPIFILLVLSIALFSVLAGPDPKPAQANSLPRRAPTPTPTPTSILTATGTSTPNHVPDPNGVWNIVSSPNTGTPNNFLFGVGGVASNDMWAVGAYGTLGVTDWQLIEHWNGTTWSLAASPTLTTPNELLAVGAVATRFAPGDVWAVGGYDSGGQSLIEHWNGLSWSVVPNPNPGTLNRFLGVAAISSSNVWAVGYFFVDGNSVSRTLVEHWDGAGWSVVPSPNLGTGYNQLNAVTAVPGSPNELWAVGTAGSSTLILHWDNNQWTITSSPNPGTNPQLYSVAAISTGDVWAVGYTGGNSGPLTLTEHWNGSTWSAVTSPNPSPTQNHLFGVTALATNNVWAVGDFINTNIGNLQTLILHWNGTNWVQVTGDNSGPSGLGFSLTAVRAIGANDIWSVGENSHTLAEHWNGTTWSKAKTPNTGIGQNVLNGVSGTTSTDVWEVGYYTFGVEERTLIEHWNGASWSIVPSPNSGKVNNVLNGVVAISPTNVWAVGSADSNIVADRTTLILHWDGTSWRIVPSPSPGTDGLNSLAGVTAASNSANDVWAVGNSSSSGFLSTLTEHWNGSTWSVVPSPNVAGTNNALNGVVALGANNVWAVGYSGSGFFSTLTEHWNGSGWSIVSSPDAGSDVLYGVSGTGASDVWADGEFDASFIEHWNGSSWSIVANVNNVASNYLRGVAAVSPGDAWAVGSDGTNPLIKHWNGSSWSIFANPEPGGGGADFGVTAITSCDVWAVGRTYATNIGFQTLDEHFTCQ